MPAAIMHVNLSHPDYSRQVQEEILAQSRAYDEVLKKFPQTGNR